MEGIINKDYEVFALKGEHYLGISKYIGERDGIDEFISWAPKMVQKKHSSGDTISVIQQDSKDKILIISEAADVGKWSKNKYLGEFPAIGTISGEDKRFKELSDKLSGELRQ